MVLPIVIIDRIKPKENSYANIKWFLSTVQIKRNANMHIK